MGYVIVQFTKSGNGTSIQAVPESWVIKKKNETLCYFPKFSVLKYIQQQSVPRADWKMYPVKQLSMKTIITYDEALDKESVARYTSGVDSETECEDASTTKKKKYTIPLPPHSVTSKYGNASGIPLNPQHCKKSGKSSSTPSNRSPGSHTPKNSSAPQHVHQRSERTEAISESPSNETRVTLTPKNSSITPDVHQRTEAISDSPLNVVQTNSGSTPLDQQPVTVRGSESPSNETRITLTPKNSSIPPDVHQRTQAISDSPSNLVQTNSGSTPVDQQQVTVGVAESPANETRVTLTPKNSSIPPDVHQGTEAIFDSPSNLVPTNSGSTPVDQQQVTVGGSESPSNETRFTLTPKNSSIPRDVHQRTNAMSEPPTNHVATISGSTPENRHQVTINESPSNLAPVIHTRKIARDSDKGTSTVSVSQNVRAQTQTKSACTSNSRDSRIQPNSSLTESISTSPVQYSTNIDCLSSTTPNGHESSIRSLHHKVDMLLQRVDDMQQSLRQHFVQKAISSDDFEFEDLHMPLDSDSDVTELEISLQDKTTRSKLRKLLCQNGGKELSKGVKKIMECCITTKTASQYILLGRKKSRGNFSGLRLHRVIQQACLRSFPEATVDKIDFYIGSYLRHAPTRPGGLKYKATASPMCCEPSDRSESD